MSDETSNIAASLIRIADSLDKIATTLDELTTEYEGQKYIRTRGY